MVEPSELCIPLNFSAYNTHTHIHRDTHTQRERERERERDRDRDREREREKLPRQMIKNQNFIVHTVQLHFESAK